VSCDFVRGGTTSLQSVPNLNLGLYMAMVASLWPDQIRNHDDPSTFPNWPFVDYPLIAIHLVADVHQPLHCATLINSFYPAPGGGIVAATNFL
jgi:hypothetical protein